MPQILITNRGGGMGDYIGAIRRGLGNGDPFAVWTQPQATNVLGGCIACQGTAYSTRIRGVEVTP